MAKVTMDRALYTDPDSGDAQVVQARLSDRPLVSGNVYYDDSQHKGSLTCLFCEAAIHHTKGSEATCGDNFVGQSPHFRTNPNVDHAADCSWERKLTKRSSAAVDKSRGYQINLNTSRRSDIFNNVAGRVYARDEDKKITKLYQPLIGREGRSIKAIGDLLKLMAKGDFARLNDSLVVHRDTVLPWEEFFIRYDRRSEQGEKRFKNLIERIERFGPQPCLMEFNVAAGVWPRRLGMAPVKSKKVALGRDGNGRPELAYPRLHVKNSADADVRAGFTAPGSYLALGYASLKTYRDERSTRRILSMEITDSRQFAKVAVRDIAAEGLARAVKSNVFPTGIRRQINLDR